MTSMCSLIDGRTAQMGRRNSRSQKLKTAKNAEFSIPYGHYSETPMRDVPQWYLEFLMDLLPRSERWLKLKMMTEISRRTRLAYEIRRDEQSASLSALEGKTARQHVHVTPSSLNRRSYAGTISPWGTRYPDSWDEMSDMGRKRWNEEQSKLFMKRPLGSLR
jgi:hypothetical protein